jgi:transcriptional regulator GlxA family with amidase domain
VCTGWLYLAAAGILDGLDATTHWARKEDLERLGAHYTEVPLCQWRSTG